MHTGGGDRLWNWPFSQLTDLCDLDVGSGHTAYHHVSFTDLYLHNKFSSNRTNFLWFFDWLSMVLRLHQHNIGYMADGFYRSDDPTNSVKALNEGG